MAAYDAMASREGQSGNGTIAIATACIHTLRGQYPSIPARVGQAQCGPPWRWADGHLYALTWRGRS